jgi:Glycosyltransferase family 87
LRTIRTRPEERIDPSIERAARVLIVTVVLILLAAYAIFSFPSRKDTLDFVQFYTAGQMVRQGLGRQLYDVGVQMQLQSAVARVHTFYSHPPFEALLFVPFTFVGYRTAYTLWTVLSFALLITAAWIVETRVQLSAALSQYLRIRTDFGLVLILFATFSPVTTCLLIGQDSMLLLLVYSLVFVLLRRGADFAAGCVLACGLFKFQFVLPFVVILLLLRKWSVLRGFTLLGTLLLLLSIFISGLAALTAYPRFLFQNQMFQRIGDLRYVPNIRGFLHLFFGDYSGVGFPILVGLFSLATLWLAASYWRHEQFDFSFSVAVIGALLASYHVYTYDLSLLLLPISIVFAKLVLQRGSLPVPLIAILGLLFVPPLHLWLVVHRLYALMFIPTAILFAITLRLPRSQPEQTRAISGAV